MAGALAATEQVLAREQKLHALDGLAAAAAHELGTPLSTITLVTAELEHQIGDDNPFREDILLLKAQAVRCRIARVSVKVPWMGQVFSTMTWPFRSMICALISPTCSLTSVSTDCSPERMRARASFTQVGHSESVDRGQPSGGLERSWLFMSGAGAHLGWKVPDSIRRLTA